MYWIKRILYSIVMLLLLIILAVWTVLSQPKISSWAVKQASSWVPGLSIAQVDGSVLDGMAIAQLVYRSEQASVVIEDAWLKVDWPTLWQRDCFHLTHLSLGRVAVDLAATPNQTETVENSIDWQQLVLPDIVLPIAVSAPQVSVHQLSISLPNSQLLSMSDLLLMASVTQHQLHIQHLSSAVQAPVAANIQLTANIGLQAEHTSDLLLQVDGWEPNLWDGQGSIMLAGDVQGVVAHLDVQGWAQRIDQMITTGDLWLDRSQACIPQLTTVTSLGRLSLSDIHMPWQTPAQVTGHARVDAYHNRIDVSGQFWPDPNFSVDIDAKQLAAFQKLLPIAGTLQAQGKLTGHWQQPLGDMTLYAQHLAWQDYQLGQLTLSIQGDQQSVQANLQAQGLPEAGKDSQLQMHLKGNPEQHQLTLTTQARQAQLALQLQGHLSDQLAWSGKLSQLTLFYPDAGRWQQTKPTRLNVSAHNAQLLDPLCLWQQETSLCVHQALWSSTAGMMAKVQLSDLSLSRLRPWLPKAVRLHGQAQANAEFSQLGHERQAQLTVQLPASSLTYFTVSGKQEISYDQVSLNAQLHNNQAQTQLQANLFHDIALSAHSQHDLQHLDQLAVSGKLTVPKLDFLSAFVPDVNQLTGRLATQFTLAGQPHSPILSAQVDMTQVQALPVATGVLFRVPQLSLRIQPTGEVAIAGEIRSEEGQAQLNGSGHLTRSDLWDMDVLLTGQRLLVAKTPQADVWLTPNIQITANPHEIGVLGQLIVPKARLRVHAIGRQAVGLSDDILLVSDTQQTSPVMRLVPNLRVHLEDDVYLSGAGLSTGITGQLLVTQSRLGNLRLQGELDTKEGSFKAYQQDLTLEQGRIIFNGVTDNPGLNMIATRKVLDETVGVRILGSLNAPKLTVFSRPTMPETDALSLLILGKKANEMTAADAALLAAKLATEDDQDPMLQRLGGEVGLDVGLENVRGEKNTGLSLGKRLTPDLYVRYVVGAFETGARFITEYRINRLFSVEIQAGQQTGGDLFYRFETD